MEDQKTWSTGKGDSKVREKDIQPKKLLNMKNRKSGSLCEFEVSQGCPVSSYYNTQV